jgi:hypothetical protein
LLVLWLYFKKLEIAQLKDDWAENNVKQLADNEILAGLWVLAEKLGIPQLQNVTIEAMHELVDAGRGIPTSSFNYVYNNTSSVSALRRYAVESCAVRLGPANFLANFPHEMLVEIATFYSTRHWALKSSNKFIKPSEYHVPSDISRAS